MVQNKTLFIDGQVFQSAAWDRGMGKYSLDLIRALVADDNYLYSKTYLVLGRNMPILDEIKQAIKLASPKIEIIELDVIVPDDPSTANMETLQSHNEAVVTQAITERVSEPDQVDYLILSLFIDQVCSVFPLVGRNILLFYDLIPFQYNERYSKLSNFQNYLARFKTLFEADVIWTISQTVADDLSINLGISHSQIYNINGAPIIRDSQAALKPKQAIPKKYLLMPSGNEIRKNNFRAVQAFELYRRANQEEDISLVLTSYFDDHTRQAIENYSQNLLFTGNVSEAELHWLYQNSEALLFVPEYEGLGLPILEAAESDKPIICSDIAVFNEMSDSAFYYADPYDIDAISVAIGQALGEEDFTTKKAQYPRLLKSYTWKETGQLALKSLKTAQPKPVITKKRIAVLAPSPASYSDIGKRVMQLHAALRDYFDIDYYLEEGRQNEGFTRPNYLPYVANVYPAASFNDRTYRNYDGVLYHIGNSEFHLDTIKNALYLPGYAIFHDTQLSNVFGNDLQYYGYMTSDRYDAEAKLNATGKDASSSFITSLVNRQLGSITHSSYAKQAVADVAVGLDYQVTQFNLPLASLVNDTKRHTTAGTRLTIGFAGIIHPAKGLDVIERVIHSPAFQGCQLHIFGLSLVSQDVLRRLQSYPNVSVDTNVTDFQFQTIMGKVDILVNFRKEYRGETSAATLEAMRVGAVPIVRNVGWYAELPDACVVKAEDEADMLLQLEQLVLNEPMRNAKRQAGIELVRSVHTYDTYAKNLSRLFNEESGSVSVNLANAIKAGDAKATLLAKFFSQD